MPLFAVPLETVSDLTFSGALHDGLTFAAREKEVEAGTAFELPVPTDAAHGSFIVFTWAERDGEGVGFTLTSEPGPCSLIEAFLPTSSDQIHVAVGAKRCVLRWDNSTSWLYSVTLSYTVQVVSQAAVRSRLERRLLASVQHGPLSAVRECLARGVSANLRSDAGHTPLLCAALADAPDAASALLRARADPTSRDAHGNNSLHLAALAGAGEATLRALVDGGHFDFGGRPALTQGLGHVSGGRRGEPRGGEPRGHAAAPAGGLQGARLHRLAPAGAARRAGRGGRARQHGVTPRRSGGQRAPARSPAGRRGTRQRAELSRGDPSGAGVCRGPLGASAGVYFACTSPVPPCTSPEAARCVGGFDSDRKY